MRVFKLYEGFKKAQKFNGEGKLPNFKSELLVTTLKKNGKRQTVLAVNVSRYGTHAS
jgi:hypothetical protein